MKKVLIAQRSSINIDLIRAEIEKEDFPTLEIHYASRTYEAVCEKMDILQPDIVITGGIYDDSVFNGANGLAIAKRSNPETLVFLYSVECFNDPEKVLAGIIKKSYKKDSLITFLKTLC